MMLCICTTEDPYISCRLNKCKPCSIIQLDRYIGKYSNNRLNVLYIYTM